MTLSPPVWTLEQLAEGAAKGLELFREQRLDEAREDYTDHFEEALGALEDLLEATDDLRLLADDGRNMMGDPKYVEAFRYLAAPPISVADLESLSGVKEAHFATEKNWPVVVSTVFDVIDAHRFPWVRDGRGPTDGERTTATKATAAQIATRRIMTARANESKRLQESLVKVSLRDAGMVEVGSRTIESLRSAPQSGEFCGESSLGGSKADVIAGLPDDRTLAIECKVSNSAVNSYKRVNLEAANKAKNWIQKFGTNQIVAAAVIGGVYNPTSLAKAQALGLTIWWSHDISQMIDWIEATSK